MKKIFYITIVIHLFFLNSCKLTNKSVSKEKEEINQVEVIKFMGSITTQPYSVDEKMFWSNQDEHAKLIIRNNDFINDVINLKNHSNEKFYEYNYAFLVKKGKTIDTLYSDYTLKSWILKKDKEEIYYYDENGEIAKNLRHTYSFFKDCW